MGEKFKTKTLDYLSKLLHLCGILFIILMAFVGQAIDKKNLKSENKYKDMFAVKEVEKIVGDIGVVIKGLQVTQGNLQKNQHELQKNQLLLTKQIERIQYKIDDYKDNNSRTKEKAHESISVLNDYLWENYRKQILKGQ